MSLPVPLKSYCEGLACHLHAKLDFGVTAAHNYELLICVDCMYIAFRTKKCCI